MINATETTYGPLNCVVVDGGPEPTIPVVVCHGYGAPGTDLVSLSDPWIRLLGDDATHFRFVFPAAPATLAELGMPDGRAWWPLNMAQLMEAIQANAFDELHQQVPPGLDAVREQLCDTITAVKADLAPGAPLALGGFSQGAMLTMDTSLRGSIDPPALLMQFSGTVVCEKEWQAATPRLAGSKVYQAHGQVDPILPYTSAERLLELLRESGTDVRFHSFMGPHTIDQESILHTVDALRQLIASN